MEVKIQIPDNCELIKDGDTYIVKEKKDNKDNKDNKPRSWEVFCKSHPIKDTEYFIDGNSVIGKRCTFGSLPRGVIEDKNLCTSKEEGEAFLALIQLRQLRKAWIGDYEQSIDDKMMGYITYSINKKQVIVDYGWTWRNSILSFPTPDMAREFLECFKDLCETAKTLL